MKNHHQRFAIVAAATFLIATSFADEIPDAVTLSGEWQPVIWGTPANPHTLGCHMCPPRLRRPQENLTAEQLASLSDAVTVDAETQVKFTHMVWGDCRLNFELEGKVRVLLMGSEDVVQRASLAGHAPAGKGWTTYEVWYHAPRWRNGKATAAAKLKVVVNGQTAVDKEIPATGEQPESVNEIGEQYGPLRIEGINGATASLRNIQVGPLSVLQDTSKLAWKDMFDGTTLSGWSVIGGDGKYRIENGEVVGTQQDPKRNTFLITDKDYGDFEFSVEVNGMEVEGDVGNWGFNSGIQFRSSARGGRSRRNETIGYQCEIDPSERAWTAGIYEEGRREWLHPLANSPELRTPLSKGKWQELRILASGSVIKAWLDGKLISHIYDALSKRGYFGLQVHFTTDAEPNEIRWRNVRIRELN